MPSVTSSIGRKASASIWPKTDEWHHQLHTDWSDPKTESFAIWIGSGGKNSRPTECSRDLQNTGWGAFSITRSKSAITIEGSHPVSSNTRSMVSYVVWVLRWSRG